MTQLDGVVIVCALCAHASLSNDSLLPSLRFRPRPFYFVRTFERKPVLVGGVQVCAHSSSMMRFVVFLSSRARDLLCFIARLPSGFPLVVD